MELGLLLCDADTLAPVLPGGLALGALDDAPRPAGVAKRPKGTLLDDTAPRDSLAEQRWGLIVPEGRPGEDLLKAVDQLRRARATQQGLKDVPIYKAKKSMSREEASDWIKKEIVGSAPETERPRYLLILGDFELVPLELQQTLAIKYYPGRLAFDNNDDYSAYAAKVCRWERPESMMASARALTFTERSSDEGRLGYEMLMDPARRITERQYPRQFPVQLQEADVSPLAPRKSLLDIAADSLPTFLWTMCHGAEVDRGLKDGTGARQRQIQGSLVFSDGLLTGEHVKVGPFLPGGIWLIIGCFGAGTPAESAYWHWLRKLGVGGKRQDNLDRMLRLLAQLPEKPFVAALPKAALSNPDGPLAVLGHIDLAWSYSFDDSLVGDDDSPIERYLRLPRYLVNPRRHSRIGTAFGAFGKDRDTMNDTLAHHYDRQEAAQQKGKSLSLDNAALSAHYALWMARQDLVGYVLLGDPAVRLPVRDPESW